jgi:hypothetical protein
MKRFALVLFLALTACQTNPLSPATKPAARVLGTLEVRIDANQISSQAKFVPIPKLQSQALVDETQLTFTSSSFQVV